MSALSCILESSDVLLGTLEDLHKRENASGLFLLGHTESAEVLETTDCVARSAVKSKTDANPVQDGEMTSKGEH